MLFDRVGGIDGHLIIGRIAVFDRKVVIVQINVEIGQDQPFANPLPDDAGHLVPIKFNDGVGDFDFLHG